MEPSFDLFDFSEDKRRNRCRRMLGVFCVLAVCALGWAGILYWLL